jgi:hypothetical protein
MENQEWLCTIKPEDIPEKYNYVAQEESGNWLAFQVKPTIFESTSIWVEIHGICVFPGKIISFGYYNINWRNTLKKIPR